MKIVGIVLSAAVIVVLAILIIMVIAENTRVLNEQKALRIELAGIHRYYDEIGRTPTAAQLATLTARIEQYAERFEKFKSSPFVITAPTASKLT